MASPVAPKLNANQRLLAAANQQIMNSADSWGEGVDGAVDGYGNPIRRSRNQARTAALNADGVDESTRASWAVAVLRRAQSYAPIEQPDGQQLVAKSNAIRDMVLGRAGSWRGAAFGSGAAGGGF